MLSSRSGDVRDIGTFLRQPDEAASEPAAPELVPAREAAERPRKQRIALLFTPQFVGLPVRKTGFVFWAETLAKLGWQTHAVTVQLSLLTKWAGAGRFSAVPPAEVNRWRRRSANLLSFIWMAPLHPATTGSRVADGIFGPALAWLYPHFLPDSIRNVARAADVIIIESSAAVVLFPLLRSIAPQARFVYCASDRLEAVGALPALSVALRRTAASYDFVRVPADAMMADFPSAARVACIPQGIDRTAFDGPRSNPYAPGTLNAVIAGDMMFDRPVVAALIERFPQVGFHAFGRMDLRDLAGHRNLTVYGEVPFAHLAAYLIHADVGIAPYVYRPALEYLAQSSLKILQYTYCRLPIVAPDFVKGRRRHVIAYTAGDQVSAVAAFERSLAFDRSTIERDDIADWDEVVGRVLRLAGVPE